MKKEFIIILLIILIGCAIALFIIRKNVYHRTIRIDEYSGSVDIERDAENIKVYEGLQLVSDDCVSTYDESNLYLLIDTDKYVGVKDNTVFMIQSFGTAKKGFIKISIKNGGAVFKIDNKLNKDSSFEVSTPNAVMSVRGTKFEVTYDEEKNETKVSVYEGEVKAAYCDNLEEEIILKRDENVTIRDDSIIREDEPKKNEYEFDETEATEATETTKTTDTTVGIVGKWADEGAPVDYWFGKDGTGTFHCYKLYEDITYTVDGNTVTITDSSGNSETATIDGDKLVFGGGKGAVFIRH